MDTFSKVAQTDVRLDVKNAERHGDAFGINDTIFQLFHNEYELHAIIVRAGGNESHGIPFGRRTGRPLFAPQEASATCSILPQERSREDVIDRWGGDEFLIFLKEFCSLRTVTERLAHLRRKWKARPSPSA